MSSLGGLYIGVSGLNVSQTALNITAHNLANVDTKGFVRQRAIMTDFGYKNLGENHISYLQQGIGADFATIKQVRDSFLDQAYRQEVGRQAFYESQYSAVSEVESLFGELQGVTFQDTLEDFWTSLQELSKEPDNVVARATFVDTAESFIERAEKISNQLNDYQVNLNTQIVSKVNRINEIGTEIKDLNYKIKQYEGAGVEKASDLRDQRNLLLDELSEIASISYKENQDTTVTVNLEGTTFVSDNMVFKMTTKKINDNSDMLKPVWVSQNNEDVFNMDRIPSSQDNTDIGSLKGLLLARGYKQAKYTDIPKSDQYATDEEYQAAVSEYNKTIDSSVITSVQAQFDQLVHGIVTTINDIFCPNKTVTISDGGVDKTVKILDESNAPIGKDADKTAGEAIFDRKSMDRYDTRSISVKNASGGYDTITARVYNEENESDNYSLFTLGEIEINEKILQDSSYIPLSLNDGTGTYDIKTAGKLISEWQKPFSTLSPNSLTKNNFNDYYTAFTLDLANRGEQMDTIAQNQESMVTAIDNQRQEVSGVSSDEELTNMIKYQHAYNAAARYVNVVSEMLEYIVSNL